MKPAWVARPIVCVTASADGASEAVALTGGYHAAFFVGALFAGAAATIGGLLLRQGAYAGDHEPVDAHAAAEAA